MHPTSQQRPFSRLALALFAAALSGCASAPLPFNLYDQSQQVWHGQMNPGDGSISADVNGKLYHGFYLVAHGTAISTNPMALFADPAFVNTVSQVDMNSARASMSAADGARLTCSFLFQGRKVLGHCHDARGQHYDLVADGRHPPSGAPIDPR